MFSKSAEQLVDTARQKPAAEDSGRRQWRRGLSVSHHAGALSLAFSVNEHWAEPCPDPFSPGDDDESRDESASASSALFLPRRISCRMKAPAATRNAIATSSGGVNAARSVSNCTSAMVLQARLGQPDSLAPRPTRPARRPSKYVGFGVTPPEPQVARASATDANCAIVAACGPARPFSGSQPTPGVTVADVRSGASDWHAPHRRHGIYTRIPQICLR